MTAPEQPGSGRAPRAGLRNLGALYLGKALIGAARLFGGGGTTLPGRAALKVSPRIIPFMAGQLPWGVAAVTGTNGKTTTAALLAAVFKQGDVYKRQIPSRIGTAAKMRDFIRAEFKDPMSQYVMAGS